MGSDFGLIILKWNDISEVAVTNPYFAEITGNGLVEEGSSDSCLLFVSKGILSRGISKDPSSKQFAKEILGPRNCRRYQPGL